MTSSEIPSTEDSAKELREWDHTSFLQRLERDLYLRRTADPPPEGWIIPGGLICASAWWEAGRSFIGGNFVATIVLVQATIEHSLTVVMDRLGRRTKSRTFNELIEAVLEASAIDPLLSEELHRLRRLRNPYVHAHSSGNREYIERAQAEANGDFYAMNELDARTAIEIGADFIRPVSSVWDHAR